jgi:hypothetical protein
MGSVAGLPAKRAAAVLFCGRLVALVKNDYNIEPVNFADFFCHRQHSWSIRFEAISIDLLGIFIRCTGFLLDKNRAFR